MSRPPLSTQERDQVKALMRFLLMVLIAVAIASVSMGVVMSIVNSGQAPVVATPTP